jgi:hypothetical protein
VEISERRFIQGLSISDEKKTLAAFLTEILQRQPPPNQEKKPKVFFDFLNE